MPLLFLLILIILFIVQMALTIAVVIVVVPLVGLTAAIWSFAAVDWNDPKKRKDSQILLVVLSVFLVAGALSAGVLIFGLLHSSN